MKLFSKIDIKEATRLTREGRLDEAMQVLKGGAAPGGAPQPSARPRMTGESGLPGSGLPGLDSLSDTLNRFASARPAPAPGGFSPNMPGKSPVIAVPDGARYEEKTFRNAAGSRAYKLYVPSGYDGSRPVPLVVMLHGCTQSPDDFAAGTRMNELAEKRTFLVAYPAQAQSANMSKCWNWFNEADQRRDAGEPSLIAGITREIIGLFAVDHARVFAAGLSAGGAAAAIMGTAYPDIYAAVGVHSGLACGAAKDMPSALNAMRQGAPATGKSRNGGRAPAPAIVFHGDRDATVHAVNGEQVIEQAGAGLDLVEIQTRGSAGGLDYTLAVHTRKDGRTVMEHWQLHGAGHAWSGGSPAGSYTDSRGPDASAEMVRFFLDRE